MTTKQTHRNPERTVKCPVEDCDAEKLARGIHLHVRQSTGNGHGSQGTVPEHVSLDDLETVGDETVEMDYPEELDTEQVARLCPYCGTPFTGKQGVLIHLGQVAGRKNHPENAAEMHEPEDFPRVKMDDQENVVEVLDDGPASSGSGPHEQSVSTEKVYRYIADLLADDRADEARRVRRGLLE